MIRVGPSHIRCSLGTSTGCSLYRSRPPFSGANAATDHQLIPYINIFYYICLTKRLEELLVRTGRDEMPWGCHEVTGD